MFPHSRKVMDGFKISWTALTNDKISLPAPTATRMVLVFQTSLKCEMDWWIELSTYSHTQLKCRSHKRAIHFVLFWNLILFVAWRQYNGRCSKHCFTNYYQNLPPNSQRKISKLRLILLVIWVKTFPLLTLGIERSQLRYLIQMLHNEHWLLHSNHYKVFFSCF